MARIIAIVGVIFMQVTLLAFMACKPESHDVYERLSPYAFVCTKVPGAHGAEWDRCENYEVICYEGYGETLQCKWKDAQ